MTARMFSASGFFPCPDFIVAGLACEISPVNIRVNTTKAFINVLDSVFLSFLYCICRGSPERCLVQRSVPFSAGCEVEASGHRTVESAKPLLVGARNMRNFPLLKALGGVGKR